MTAANGQQGRRAYGTGTLRVVGRSWIASWYGPDGRRIQRKVGPARSEARADGLTKAQAGRALRRMREFETPRPAPDGQRVTMEEAGQEFCHRLELKGRRKSHRLTVASDLRNHVAPFFAGKMLDRVQPEDIERYVAAKRKTLAIKTIRNHVNTMHSIFDLGLRKGWCQTNPVKLADRPDPFERRERFYKRGVGPSRWLMVVVSFEKESARIVTALGYGHGRAPAGWNQGTSESTDSFSTGRTTYDADGDVLYLARGESNAAADAALTPEGHGVRYGDDGQVIGVTIINARRLLDRDGHLTITLPHEVRVDARDLAGALA